MSNLISKYMTDINEVFGIGVEVLNGTRSLKGISLDLKLLAINGIVQAAKIGTSQGQSLITLSGFLSDLPIQIAPELSQLEVITSKLSGQLTICSIAVRRFLKYSTALQMTLDRVLKDLKSSYNSSDFDLLDLKELDKLSKHISLEKASEHDKKIIKAIADRNINIVDNINTLLYDAHTSIIKARKKIESIKRNGFIANYMGSNILIESSYLSTDQKSFSGLVSNIREIVLTLDNQLFKILESINHGDSILNSLAQIRTAT